MNELVKTSDIDNYASLYSEAVTALDSMHKTIFMFDQHNSWMQTALLVIGEEKTPTRKLRQIAAELQSRQSALVEVRSSILKKKVQVRVKRDEAEKVTGNERELLLIEASSIEDEIALAARPYKGALRAIIRLKTLHDKIYESLVEKYGKVDDSVFEQEEARHWIIHIFGHALRDLRATGTISIGTQSVLTRMGLDPRQLFKILANWLDERDKIDDISSKYEEDFLSGCADKYSQIVVHRLEAMTE